VEVRASAYALAKTPENTMSGLTFDTGALIALERRRQRMSRVYTTAVLDGVIVTVPIVVISEWWRGRSKARETVLRGVRVEPIDLELAKTAGDAMGAVRGSTAIDALVMASAARRGDVVYTSDIDDLERLRDYFPSVRVLAA
jgi:predicted nucleic acid-binding protein